ncbi:MAG: hypothetical protein HUU55_00965 [Myxococcales bacterium]|nr:hypothetical protein [Myxococcales bacterium]
MNVVLLAERAEFPDPVLSCRKRIERRIGGFVEAGAHNAVVLEELSRVSSDVAVSVLDSFHRDPDLPEARSALLAYTRIILEPDRGFSYYIAGRWYRKAVESGYISVAMALLSIPPHRVRGPSDELPSDPLLSELELGWRKTKARGTDRGLLLRLLSDPTIEVIRILLQNPKIVEADVIRAAAKRPIGADVLTLIATHSRWMSSKAVRKTIVLNPYTPTNISVLLAPLLPTPDLKSIAVDGNLHPVLQRVAAYLASVRHGQSLRGSAEIDD